MVLTIVVYLHVCQGARPVGEFLLSLVQQLVLGLGPKSLLLSCPLGFEGRRLLGWLHALQHIHALLEPMAYGWRFAPPQLHLGHLAVIHIFFKYSFLNRLFVEFSYPWRPISSFLVYHLQVLQRRRLD